jgi:hypothetical protein
MKRKPNKYQNTNINKSTEQRIRNKKLPSMDVGLQSPYLRVACLPTLPV